MSHIDPEVLALQALGESAAGEQELRHLDACAECRAELAHLARTAAVGRSSIGEGQLLVPPPRVWSRIADELGLDAAATPAVRADRPEGSDVPPETGSSQPRAATFSPPAPIPLRRRTRAIAVAAAAAVAVGGVGVAWTLLRPQPDVVATASLEPFPGWSGSTGTAALEANPDGSRSVTVRLDAPAADGYREVWLITSDATALVSLGVLDGREGTFTVPAGIDTSEYDLVDVSEEPYDGDPAHSGDSIVRGQLGA